MNKKDIGKQLKVFRQKAGLTQAELSELVNIHEKQISRIEAGIHFPTFDNFVKILNVLGVEMSDFKTKPFLSKQEAIEKLEIMLNEANEKELNLYCSIIENIKNSLF